MSRSIKYDKIKKPNFKFNTYDKIPKMCPKCKKPWKPEAPPLRIMRESFFDITRMAKEYVKVCDFCGYNYHYWG